MLATRSAHLGRRALTVVAAISAFIGLAPSAGQARLARAHAASAQRQLTRALSRGIKQAGGSSGAFVVDLKTGRTLFSGRASTPRLPASVEKLYTAATVLERYGPSATLTTSVFGTGKLVGHTWVGNLYLKGGGDPTFGAESFDRAAYGGGATVQQLASNLLRASGIHAVRGAIVGDGSYLDSVRGTPASGGRPNFYLEGQLSGLIYDRGFTSAAESAFQRHPWWFAANALASTLKADGVRLQRGTRVRTGATPADATLLASVASPPMATLLRWTLTPSDNFFAEMLLKDLGARFGLGGTTADGVAVVQSTIADSFGLHPIFDDGSGLSYYDHTSPRQVVGLLSRMASEPAFVDALAIAGETGTLQDEMNGTVAQGRCRAKTGTLQYVSNLAGYCLAADGHTLAFAFLMNNIDPLAAHPIQDRMAEALAAYDG